MATGCETVTDLEEHAFKRDRGFLVKLAISLSLAVVAASLAFMGLTSDQGAGCAARSYLGEPQQGPQAQ